MVTGVVRCGVVWCAEFVECPYDLLHLSQKWSFCHHRMLETLKSVKHYSCPIEAPKYNHHPPALIGSLMYHTKHCILHDIRLHYIRFDHITLHYITLHYVVIFCRMPLRFAAFVSEVVILWR